MGKEYLDKAGLTYFWSKIKAYVANAVKVTGVKGNAESSYRTGNVNITAANVGAVGKNGDTMTGNLIVPAIRAANTYYGLTFGRTTSTPVETILYTGIKWDSGSHMPVIHITGYAYGLQSPVEFKIGFYIYSDKIGWCGATNMGSWEPTVYLFKHTVDSQDYVAVGLAGSCYFLQLQADLQDEMGKFTHTNLDSSLWSWAFLTTTGNIPTPDGGVTCIAVPYKANILKPAKAISADEAVKIKQTVASSEDDCFPTGTDEIQFFRASTVTASGGDGHIIGFRWGSSPGYGAQIHIDTDPTYYLSIRQRNSSGVWQPWKKIYTENDAINASKVNNHTVESDVPANAKFTDTVTTATTSGNGNAVTAISASNGALTVTKGATFLTSHQDISGKADKSATVSTVAWDSTNKKLTKTINGTISDVVTASTLRTGLNVADGAEVNQNAFSNVKVGSTTVEADTKTDTLELVAGSNVTITPDATNDKITIAATDTTYESKSAASGGTAVSLVTTGEKYTWNNKSTVPTNHASTATTYGTGSSSNYGHVKLSDSTSSTSGTSGGIAATPSAVKSAYDLANTANGTANTALSGVNGNLIYDHTFTISNGVATFTPHVYQKGEEVTSNYAASCFTWKYRLINGSEVSLTTKSDRGCDVTISNLGYGGHVIGAFTPPE